MTVSCRCPACTALNERYVGDMDLLTFYRRRLLIRGWAGKTDPIEKAYIHAHSTWAKPAADRARERGNLRSKPHEKRAKKTRVVPADL